MAKDHENSVDDVPAGAGGTSLPTGNASPSVGGGLDGDRRGGVGADVPAGDVNDLDEEEGNPVWKDSEDTDD